MIPVQAEPTSVLRLLIALASYWHRTGIALASHGVRTRRPSDAWSTDRDTTRTIQSVEFIGFQANEREPFIAVVQPE